MSTVGMRGQAWCHGQWHRAHGRRGWKRACNVKGFVKTVDRYKESRVDGKMESDGDAEGEQNRKTCGTGNGEEKRKEMNEKGREQRT
jgi:hypothetical protein